VKYIRQFIYTAILRNCKNEYLAASSRAIGFFLMKKFTSCSYSRAVCLLPSCFVSVIIHRSSNDSTHHPGIFTCMNCTCIHHFNATLLPARPRPAANKTRGSRSGGSAICSLLYVTFPGAGFTGAALACADFNLSPRPRMRHSYSGRKLPVLKRE
jgi:hypothetical protein